MTEELLHLVAAEYASNRKNGYIEAMKSGTGDAMSEDQLNMRWLAHYEGYREGFRVSLSNTKFTTNHKQDRHRTD